MTFQYCINIVKNRHALINIRLIEFATFGYMADVKKRAQEMQRYF